MNILASYDWLKQYVDLKSVSPDDFSARVSLSGPGVERLYPQGEAFRNIVLGHVVDVKPHPNADKLRIAMVDVSGKKPLEIVCGGSNLRDDQWVAVALANALVRWHGEGEPVRLEPAEIRGIKSDGMICAANEIGLFDAWPHAEREILDLGAALEMSDAKWRASLRPGMNLADVLGFADDVVMDIEVTTNRPDAYAMVGLAREAAAILKKPFTWKPAKLLSKAKQGTTSLKVSVEDKVLCPRYMAVRMSGVNVGPSPWWLKRRLLSAGLRPINTAVDITNFVMLELGQPMHVFDAEKLTGGSVHVRAAKKGERMSALDGETYTLQPSMLVIADAEKPIAVAGVMGGEETGATSDTTDLIFEAASFDPVSIRKTARALNLYSDSQQRFEKGLSTQAPEFALARAIELCFELCGGKLASNIVDVGTTYKPRSYSVSFEQITDLIGVAIKPKDAKDTLDRLGFSLKTDSKKLTATVPWWRDHDIESGRDLVEEIARVYGYANIPSVFPAGRATEPQDKELQLEKKLRHILKGSGLTETVTYSFTSGEIQKLAGYDPSKMLRVQNPLSSDFEFMRTSLIPSLLQVVSQNQERYRQQSLFEIAHIYYATERGWKTLPEERLMLGLAMLAPEAAAGEKTQEGGNHWKKMKGTVEHIFYELGIEHVQWKRVENESLWHPGRSAQAFDGEHLLATLGEIHPSVASRYKFEGRVALAELSLKELVERARDTKRYTPLASFPEAKRDLAIVVPKDVYVHDIIQSALKSADALQTMEWFDTYTGKEAGKGMKSVAFHLSFGATNRTLETEEVDAAMQTIIETLEKHYKAHVRE